MSTKALTVSTSFIAKDKFSQTMKKMTSSVSSFAQKSQIKFAKLSRSIRSLRNTTQNLAKPFNKIAKWTFGGIMIGAGVAVRKFVNKASKIENAVAGFTPLLGSVEKAQKLVDMLNKTAATTPFQFENISNTAGQLLPLMNGDLNKTIDTFRILGDTAGGNAQKLESITRGYTKVLGKGKADMEALNMITEAGVPIMDQLSKMYGVSINELYEMSRQGKISASDITKVFKKMTSEGGIFFKGMEISSQTWSGLLSTLKDNINLTFAAIGTQALPVLKQYQSQLIEVAQKARAWVDNNQDLIKQKIDLVISKITNTIKFFIENSNKLLKIIKIVVIAITALKTITLVFNAALAAINIATGIATAAQWLWVAALKAGSLISTLYAGALVPAIKAAWAFTAALLSNPITWIVLGIAALIVGIVALVKNWKNIVSWVKESDNWFAKLIRGSLKPIIWIFNGIKDAWQNIKAAFKGGGIGEGIKQIGKSLLSFVLAPLEGILNLVNKVTKGKVGGEALAKISAIRDNLNYNEDGKALNKDATIEQTRIEKNETTKNEKVDIRVSSAQNTQAEIIEDTSNQVQLTPNLGWI